LANAGAMRDGFIRAYLPSSLPAQARLNFIQNVAVPKLKAIVDDETLFPAARVNACVMLASLDEKLLDRRNRTAPQPSLEALRVLNGVLQGNSPEYLKASAFSGILRHVQIDGAVSSARIPDATTNALVGYVTQSWDKILTEDAELKDDLNLWKIGRSIEFMASVRAPARTADFFDRILALISEDSKAPVWVKINAVRAISQLPLTGMDQAKVNKAVEQVGDFVSKVLAAEAKNIQDGVDTLVYDNLLYDNVDLETKGTNYTDTSSGSRGGSGMGMGMGGMGMGGMGMGGAWAEWEWAAWAWAAPKQ